MLKYFMIMMIEIVFAFITIFLLGIQVKFMRN